MDQSARFCVECGAPIPSSVPEPRGPSKTATSRATAKTAAKAPPPPAHGAPPPPPSKRASTPPAAPKQKEEKAPYSRRTLQLNMGAVAAPPKAGTPMTEALGRISEHPGKPTPPEPDPPTLPKSSPPAPPPDADSALIGDILGDLDSTFDALLSEPGKVPQSSRGAVPEAQILFKQIAAAYVGPVRAFMLELRLGEASKDWIQVCSPAVSSMVTSATQMGLAALAATLSELKVALDAADTAPGTTIGGKSRDELLAKAEALMAELPETFGVDAERERREPIIVRSLLGQVSGVRKVQLDKIYRAGLTSLAMFAVASARELSETTGLDFELCEQIVARFLRYKQESLAAPAGVEKGAELKRLGELGKELEQLNKDYDGDKRRVRQRRGEVMHEANVLLARMGDVEFVERLEKFPFSKKAEELVKFVADARKRAG